MSLLRYCMSIVLLLFLSGSGFSQNWQPYLPGNEYLYDCIDTSGNDPTSIGLRIDSTFVMNGDSHYLFNPVRHVPGENHFPYLLYTKGDNILGGEMIKRDSGRFEFVINQRDTFVIHTRVPLHTTWTVNDTFTASMDSVYIDSVFNQTDSIIEIGFSDSTRMKISKRFGIISTSNFVILDSFWNYLDTNWTGFPYPKRIPNQYNLLGITGMDVGIVLQKRLDFFDYDIGDVFVKLKYNTNYPNNVSWINTRVEITNKEVFTDSIRYSRTTEKLKTVKETKPNGATTKEYSSWNSKKIVSLLPQDHRLNDLPGTVRFDDWWFRRVDIKEKDPLRLVYKFEYRIIIDNEQFNSSMTYETGLGKSASTFEVFGGPFHGNSSSDDYHCIKKLRFGIDEGCNPLKNHFEHFHTHEDGGDYEPIIPERKVSGAAIKIFPNPFQDEIHIKNEFGQEGILKVFDITGRLILSQSLTKETDFTIKTAQWRPGIYILKSKTKGGREFKHKLIRSR